MLNSEELNALRALKAQVYGGERNEGQEQVTSVQGPEIINEQDAIRALNDLKACNAHANKKAYAKDLVNLLRKILAGTGVTVSSDIRRRLLQEEPVFDACGGWRCWPLGPSEQEQVNGLVEVPKYIRELVWQRLQACEERGIKLYWPMYAEEVREGFYFVEPGYHERQERIRQQAARRLDPIVIYYYVTRYDRQHQEGIPVIVAAWNQAHHQ